MIHLVTTIDPTLDELNACADEVLDGMLRFLDDPAGRWTDLVFTGLALRIFRAQVEAVPVYREWAELELGSRGLAIADVRRWWEVPALPIGAFKRTRVAAHPTEADIAVWESSTTTSTTPSRHHLPRLDVYETSLRAGVAAALLSDPTSVTGDDDLPLVIQLAPSGDELPSSSLSHMLDIIRTQMGRDGGAFDVALEGSTDDAWLQLSQAAAANRPVVLVATSFALVHLLEQTANRPALALPRRSRVMDTGGYKGRSREVDRDELLRTISARLGVDASMVENEYGMSELSSQAWLGTIAQSLGRPLPGHPPADGQLRWQPPWMRTRVVNPETLEEVGEGEQGVLVHYDLANVFSCAAIRTEDLGIRRAARWSFAGRASDADLRGCSLRLEDLLG